MKEIEALSPFLTDARKNKIEDVLDRRTRDVTIMLERFRKVHNLSAILRTCEALGVQDAHIVAPKEEFGEVRVTRGVSQNAHRWLSLSWHKSSAEAAAALKAKGYTLAAASLDGDAVDFSEILDVSPLAIVAGNELEGVAPETLKACDVKFKLPMYGFVQSYNVSVAAAIALNSLMERRRERSPGVFGLTEDERIVLKAKWYKMIVKYADQILRRLDEYDEREINIKTTMEPGA